MPRPRLALVLQQPIPGGTWEMAREVVSGLAAVNRRRGRFDLAFVHHPHQPGLASLDADVPRLARELVVTNGLADLDVDADMLFFLTFFFPAPLVRRRFGVLVLDMVLFELAGHFSPQIAAQCRDAIRPTLEAADLLVTTSAATRTYLHQHSNAPRSTLVPLACETFRRFDRVTPRPVARIDRPFLLCVTNYSAHKGGGDVVDAYLRLRGQMGDRCPALVIAGCMTETFSPRCPTPAPTEYVADIRRRLAESDVPDLHCLGMIADDQLAWLYSRCQAVVSAARADNGSYCMIEGQWFGRPLISADDPAARELANRFGLSPRFFPPGDSTALCEQMRAALDDSPLVRRACERLRLADAEFSRDRFAERLYDSLQSVSTGMAPLSPLGRGVGGEGRSHW